MRRLHPSIASLLSYFDWKHLPPHLQSISIPFCALARTIADTLEGPEAAAALRKLLEAKDCAVRAAVTMKKAEEAKPEKKGCGSPICVIHAGGGLSMGSIIAHAVMSGLVDDIHKRMKDDEESGGEDGDDGGEEPPAGDDDTPDPSLKAEEPKAEEPVEEPEPETVKLGGETMKVPQKGEEIRVGGG